MADFAKIRSTDPVRNGAAVMQPLPGSGVPMYSGRAQLVSEPSGLAQMVRVDSAYKTGGGTGWERPGSNLT